MNMMPAYYEKNPALEKEKKRLRDMMIITLQIGLNNSLKTQFLNVIDNSIANDLTEEILKQEKSIENLVLKRVDKIIDTVAKKRIEK